MQNYNFTVPRINALTPPERGEEVHADTGVPGLCIRVRSSGAASYFVRYRLGGRGSQERRFTVGKVSRVPLAEARELAGKVLAKVRLGQDPSAEKRARGRAGAVWATTVADLVDVHEREQLSRGVVHSRETARMLRRDFVNVVGGNRDVRTLTRNDLVKCIERMRDGSPGHTKPRPGLAPVFRAAVHGALETALARGDVDINPLAGYRRPPQSRAQRLQQAERRAGRMLSMEELASLWRACGDPRVRQAWGAYIRALCVLGTRRAELAAARLDWLRPAEDGRPPLLVFPPALMKGGRQHILPLPALVMGLINGVHQPHDSDLIFPGAASPNTGRTVPISGWSRSWASLLEVARDHGLTGHLRLHDLRKSARSHWARLNIPDRVGEALLGHVERNTLLFVYDRRDMLDEKVEAMSLWAREIEATLEARAKSRSGSADIVPLHPPQKTKRRRASS